MSRNSDSFMVDMLQRRIRELTDAGKLKQPYRIERGEPPDGASWHLATDTTLIIEPEMYDLYVAHLKATTDPNIQ